MEIRKDILQHTEAWHQIRYGKIGGTRCGDLMVGKPITESALFFELLSEHTNDFFPNDDAFVSEAMERGSELEPMARQELENVLGLEFNQPGWIQGEGLIGISPDGITENLKTACEIKCPLPKTHEKYLMQGGIPKEYVWQCLHWFAVCDSLDTLYFCSYNPDHNYRQLFIKEIHRNESLTMKIGRTALIHTVGQWAELIKQKSLEMEKAVNAQLETMLF